ncbi:MAG: LytTR family transcriptional regulator [Lachnospiraceae bacterium]|nr:LytTR family transcriptional regulator [Lachnospiraceae bacterium]
MNVNLDISHTISGQSHFKVLFNWNRELFILNSIDILYVDFKNRVVTWHTDKKKYYTKVTIKSISNLLLTHGFFECYNGILVNYNHIKSITENDIFLSNGLDLPISRRNRSELVDNITSYSRSINDIVIN